MEALSNTGRERAARGEARRSARKFPALEAKAQALLYPVSTGSGGSGSGGTGGSTGGSAGANGGAGGARSISRPGFTPAWQRDLRIGVVIGDVNEGDAQAGGAAVRHGKGGDKVGWSVGFVADRLKTAMLLTRNPLLKNKESRLNRLTVETRVGDAWLEGNVGTACRRECWQLRRTSGLTNNFNTHTWMNVLIQ